MNEKTKEKLRFAGMVGSIATALLSTYIGIGNIVYQTQVNPEFRGYNQKVLRHESPPLNKEFYKMVEGNFNRMLIGETVGLAGLLGFMLSDKKMRKLMREE